MHKCSKCGKEFEGKFCPDCGAKWIDPDLCPKCGTRHGPNDKFCQECGTRLDGKVNCPKCGAEMEANASFCGECGAKLDGKQANGKVAGKGTAAGKVKSIISLSGVILIMLSALMGLVFAFVTGVTLVDTESGQKTTGMLYDFFGDNYKDLKQMRDVINATFDWSNMGSAREFALYFPVVLGTVVSAVGLLGVVALSGLTCYKAYKKYYKKEEANVVAPAVATYFTFVTMATVLLAITAMNGDDSKTQFSAPTLAGLITGGVLLGLGVILLALTNFKEFKGFNGAVGGISSIVVCALVVVVVALVSLPAGGISVSSIYYGSTKMDYGLFTGMQGMLLVVEDDDAMMKIIAFATIGGVAGIALAVTSAVTLFRKVPALCDGKNKGNLITGGVIAGLSVIYLVFTILTINAMLDTPMFDGADKDMITRNYAVPIALLVMAVLACVAEFVGKFVRKTELSVEMAE